MKEKVLISLNKKKRLYTNPYKGNSNQGSDKIKKLRSYCHIQTLKHRSPSFHSKQIEVAHFHRQPPLVPYRSVVCLLETHSRGYLF